jgi:NADH-quinone oxidoreductase subunit C
MLPDQLKEVPLAAAVDSHVPDSVLDGKLDHGELTLVIAPEQLHAVCRALKEDQEFVRLSSITAVDWYPMEPRFEAVYHLHSLARNQRLRLNCKLPGDNPEVDSVVDVWPAANWYEREVFDLFGIVFRNHPDLKRILMPEDWQGHPLRKDFPVHGHKYGYQNEG